MHQLMRRDCDSVAHQLGLWCRSNHTGGTVSNLGLSSQSARSAFLERHGSAERARVDVQPPAWVPEEVSTRMLAIQWAVSRLTADEARGKVARLTEALKQMKLMQTEIRLVKDALRKQQKELASLEREGVELGGELESEQKRRVELAKMLEKAKSDFPLLDPSKYHVAAEDLLDKPLLTFADPPQHADASQPDRGGAGTKAATAAPLRPDRPAEDPSAADAVFNDLLSLWRLAHPLGLPRRTARYGRTTSCWGGAAGSIGGRTASGSAGRHRRS